MKASDEFIKVVTSNTNNEQAKMISNLKEAGLLKAPQNKLITGPDIEKIERQAVVTNFSLFC